ncbi:MAG TPA: circularly permuted type 2 ATP-grasp protein [Puia sp.]|uniref:circularly permuted type 2 ATP-grasp protein n=1 Tax=Puia sp. TaxID=2045100 RepID=UPI002CFC95F1|nr:circularly permuted type 2 ATP-grasp protein [Puia sp.]HVU98730.1 circularly permuted type 2 ATP-grasp protein [Puia sp.]
MDHFADQARLQEGIGEDGKMPLHWAAFFRSYARLGSEEIAGRNEDLTRLLRENGVTYNIYGDPNGLNRPWKLDMIPFLISNEEWPVMEAGLLQRARLLNLILEDIYGEGRLVRSGILPFELLYNHPGFLRQCSGIPLPGRQHLVMYSADLARSREGKIWVVSDRTQAPSGSGYALENRTAMTRVVPELFEGQNVRHLSPYFNALRDGLNNLAPRQRTMPRPGGGAPRIVILTPGSSNETYFEHAYLSSYLGFTLVQGNDLIVKDSYVWLKTMGGLERVDVILRRVDDIYCDPLELKADSQLGVPGLLQAVRSGHVSIANPIGSGVLENPGMMPFLQPMARYLLSEDLLIPTIATWWCGQPKEMNYVLNLLSTLVIKKIARNPAGSSSIDGAALSHAQLQQLKAQIIAHPALYVGQEKVDISSTPSLINGKMESRKVLFRSFLVSSGDGYVAMSGGLCRTSSEPGNFIISNQSGGISKDAWILSPEPDRILAPLKETPDRGAAAEEDMLPSHAAENLFWVGRYTERVLGNARFLRTVMQFLAEGNKGMTESNRLTERSLLVALTQYTYTYPGFTGPGSDAAFANPWAELKEVLLNEKRAGSLKFNFLQFQRAIHEVREHWSTDTWRVLRTMEEELAQDIPLSHQGHLRMLHTLDNLITFIVAFIGLNRESISREQGWIVLDIGRKIEQSLLLLTMLKTTLVNRSSDQVEYSLRQSVLMSHESLVNYRYKYRRPIDNRLVLDFLLFDPNNPRSLTYHLQRLRVHLKQLPNDQAGYGLTEYERLILEADTLLKLSDKDSLAAVKDDEAKYGFLDDLLTRMYGLLVAIPAVISKTYFKHEVPHFPSDDLYVL